MKKDKISRPIKNIVISYLVFGIVWIIFSDSLAGLIIDDIEVYQKFQSLKGLIYIAVTGAFLYLLLKRNLKELKKKEEELYYQAYYDSLSSLPNKRALYRDLSKKISDDSSSFALFYLNLTNIDNLAEIKGYTHGSDLIKKLALTLREKNINNHSSSIYSYNYDKFILVFDELNDKEEIKETADEILNTIHKLWDSAEIDYYINIEIGISTYPESGRDVEALISSAQLAAHNITSDNKNYQIYEHQMFLDTLEYENLKRDLRTAIKNEEFELYYQPKIKSSNNEICSLEALIRWNHPDLGMVTPYKFIKIAEETGLIKEIGDWVIENAFKDLLKWQQKYNNEISISVNLSPIELYDKNKVNKIEKLQQKYKINKNLFEFEITENALVDNRANPIEILKELKDSGFSIALDDFGIGYSSYSHLSRLPLNTLKIDKSFIDRLTDEKNIILIDAIIKLSHKMKLKVVAEGIETAEQLRIMKDLNCDEIQGYYFYKPLPAGEIEEILDKQELN